MTYTTQGLRRAAAALSALAIAVTTLSACGGSSAGGQTAESMAEMDPVILTATDISPEGSVSGQAYDAMIEQVSEASDDKITFETYFSSALMPGEEMLTGVGAGLADMGQMVTSYFPQELPVANFLNELGALPNVSYPLGAMQAGAAAKEMFAKSEPLVKEFESHNLKVLSGNYSHRYSLFCSKPLDSLQAAKGTRARTGGQVWGAELEAMGMVPVPLPVGEMYEGLQRGVVDCVVLNPNSNIDFSLWEVASYFYQVDMSGFVGSAFIMNLDTWNSLPADAQQVLQEGVNTYWAVSNQLNAEYYARFATEGTSEHDVEFGETEEFDRVLADFQAEQLANIADKAPSGLKDPDGFVAEFQGYLDKWESILVDELGFEEEAKDPASVMKSFAESVDHDIAAIAERMNDEQ